MNTILNIIKFIRNIIHNTINWNVCKQNNYTYFDMIQYELNNYNKRKNN